MAESESNRLRPGESVEDWFARMEVNSEIEAWEGAVAVNVVFFKNEILSITGPFDSVPDALAAALVQAEELSDGEEDDGQTVVKTLPMWSP